MNKKLLPNFYKTIAFTVGVLALTALILKHYLVDLLPLEQERLGWIIKTIILISLLSITFSKEKNESAELSDLRAQELKGAVGFGGFVVLLNSVQEIIFWDGSYEVKSAYGIMLGILFFTWCFSVIRKGNYRKLLKANINTS